MEFLLSSDEALFRLINGSAGASHILDSLMLFLSAKWVWLPLYAILAWLLYRAVGVQQIIWYLLGAAVLVVLTDQGSVQFFKEVFQRLRPCHDPKLADVVYLPGGKCGGQFGFVSSHAANVFGLASFITNSIGKTFRFTQVLFLWAALIAYSRVYLGVHYPSDVLIGGIFGLLIGISLAIILRKQLN